MRRAVFNRLAALACMAWLVAMFGTGSAQEWRELQETGANFYDIQRSFYKANAQLLQKAAAGDEEGFEDEKKGTGYTQFKRWEYWMEPRVYPSGILPEPGQEARAFQQYLQQRYGALMKGAATPASVTAAIPSANWTSLGPTSWVLTSNSVAPGLGRVSAITFHPTDPNTIFLGTPAGGLWKSTNGGASWSTNTDNLLVLGVSSIVIDPSNPNVMYLATGDNDGSDTYSIGVLKSTDGGANWNTTGLNWTITQSRKIYKLLMHPTNSNIILAATTDGIYKTTDGGTNWVRKISSSWKDIEFKPGDPTIVYAAWNTLMYRSTATGDNWTSVALPSNAMNRFAIAVTPANSNYVYILASKSADNSFLGLYRSTDSGLTFTTQSTTPNIFGYQTDGSDAGKGQGFYDIAFNVSPTNADEVYVGGVNIWKSTNGGVNWTNKTHWVYNTNPNAYVHADVHLFEFNGSNIYTGTDGGFYKSTDGATTWSDLSAGMNTTQYYRIGSDPNSANLVYGGAQDNTITRYSGSNIWDSFLSGDGAECLVDRTNSNIVYSCTQNGSLKRSSNAGVTWSSIKSNITETGGWVTPYVMDPVSNTTLYAGYVNVWKTTNSGTSWTKLSSFANTATIVDLQVAPSNANYIYVSKTANVYRSSDGGTNWTDITAGLPAAAYKQIAVASNDPQKIWITLSGYLSGSKVYASTNGGTTWTNYSGTLPNLPFNTIVYHNNGGMDALYAGADVGVYYRDNTLSDWQLYQTGLPNVKISELEVHASSGKLRAGTFGRGLWETDLVSPSAAALAFDGTNDYVSASLLSTATSNVTLEGWVKYAGGVGQTILYNGNTSTSGYGIIIDGSGNIAGLLGSVTVASTGVSPTIGTWTHLALVGSGTSWSIYKDGTLIHSFSATPNTPTNGFAIGANPQTGTANFNGVIDEVRFWNYARSATQINASMNCELSGSPAGLMAYYKFNQGFAGANNTSITSLTDASGNGQDGTFNNFALTGSTSNFVASGGVTTGNSCPPPPPGAALAFDGVNDYVTASSFSWPTGGAITVEFWNYVASSDVHAAIAFTIGSTNNPNRALAAVPYAGGQLIWDYGYSLGDGELSLSYTPYLDKWTHVALVSEGNGGSFKGVYLDGVLVASGTISDGPDVALSGLTIGAWTVPSEYHKGKIDEFRIWNVVRSQADIQAKMNCELTGAEANLVAYYKFNHGLSEESNAGVTTLTDMTSGGNNGTLNNFALAGATSNWVTPGGVTSGTTCTAAALSANAGNDQPRSGGATKLNGFASGGNGAYQYEWSVASGPNASGTQFSNSSAAKTVFTPTAKGNYVLHFTAKDGMNAIASDNVAVTVNAMQSASISGPDPVDPGSLNSYTVTTDVSNPTFLWVVTNGTITEEPSDNPPPGDANTRNPVLIETGNPNLPMLVEVYVTDGNTNDVVYAFKSVSITNPNALTANAGADRSIIVGGSTTLGGSPSALGGVAPFTYEWSPTTGLNDPNAANPLAQPITTTTYTLTVTDGFNTIATDEVTVTVTVLNVKPFVFVGNKVTLKSTKQSTPGGDIHSNGLLIVEKGYPSTYNSNLTAIGKITINTQNTINGNVKSQTSISNSGTITGTKTIGSVPAQSLPSLTYSAGGSNKTVPSSGSLTLAPGSYGIVTLNSSGTLKLRSGDYYFNELRNSSTANNSVIEIDLSSGNPVTINVVTNLQFSHEIEIRLLPNGESDSKLVTFNTKQSTVANWGREGYFLGNFNAPNAVVTLVKNSQLRGTICAKEILVSNDCLFLHHDSPGTLPGPGNLPKTAGEVYEVEGDQSAVTSYQLEQNYPNPFNPETGIRFALPEASSVTITLYSLSGQVVRELVNGAFAQGRHQVIWNGRDDAGAAVAGGIYFYRLTVQGANGEAKFTQTRKMTFVK